VAKIDVQLRQPRPVQLNLEALRAVLEQRADQWRSKLRTEPQVARLPLRRLVGAIHLFDPAKDLGAWARTTCCGERPSGMVCSMG